ncbi:hypothetical protein DL767_009910 [Monosporascus sp. MG133]|nr:hypothetical protein DL767_009910 [Monosporascus sp. MG133]
MLESLTAPAEVLGQPNKDLWSAHVTEAESSDASVTSPDTTTPVAQDPGSRIADADLANEDETDPICIVGLACHLPGNIDSPSALWDFLINKKSAQGPVPKQRFNMKGFYHPDAGRAGVMGADGGYFLQRDVRQFENSFFGINNLEATYMDPQQRQLLEVVYECLENAGIPMDHISGTNTGVFVGNFTMDYQTMQTRDPEYGSRYTATGSGTSIMANRISHIFNLHGPSLTLDTACSSTLYCLHNAVRAIQCGDCDGAIVAGVNLIMSPEQHLGTMKGGVLSPTSTCHTFDVSADGYGRAEGANAVYLKRLSTALKNEDKVWAVIRGTAINANGRTPGIAQPSAALQEAVIRKAYSNAGLELTGTDYIECHGTGTSIGDPIEVDALASFFCPRDGHPLMIGSVKTNLGHSEAASGLTSIIKVALAFENECIPPTYGLLVLPVSAVSAQSLVSRVRQISEITQECDAETLIRLAFTLTKRRSQFRSRHFFLAQIGIDGSPEFIQAETSDITDLTSGPALPFAFVFTGQGAQYEGMGKELLRTDEKFASTIRELDGVLRALPSQYAPNWTLEQTILDPPNASQVNNVTRSQPLCTAIQIALVNILHTWDVRPTAVVGHSSGEIAAAYAAGLLTAAQAIRVAYFRGYVMERLQTQGRMIAVGLGIEASESLIKEEGLEEQISVACINAPGSVTISGFPEGIDAFETKVKAQNIFARKLETGDRAYHSYMMQEVGPLYEQLLAQHLGDDIAATNQTVKMYSSVGRTGDQLRVFQGSIDTVKYWRENLEKPVQFYSALKRLVVDGNFHLIEVGPHSALKGPIQQIRTELGVEKRLLPYTSTLIRKRNANWCMRNLAGTLFLYNHDLDWYSINGLSRSGMTHLSHLPPYPWDYSAGLLWYEPRASIELRNRQYVRHELLGSKQVAGDDVNWSWRNILRLSEMPWICGHKIEDQIVFPATGYVAIAIEAISQVLGIQEKIADHLTGKGALFELCEVNIIAALVLREEDDQMSKGTELHTTMAPRKLSTATVSSEWYDFTIYSWIAGKSTLHCAGKIRVDGSTDFKGAVTVSDHNRFEVWAPDRWYQKGKEEGLSFEGGFQSLTRLRTDAKDPYSTYYPMHPITIDACLQAAIMGSTAGNLSTLRAYLPVFISECRIRTVGRNGPDWEATIHTTSRRTGLSTQRIDSTLRSPDGRPVIELKDVHLSLYTGKKSEDLRAGKANLLRHPCLRTYWKPDISTLYRGAETQINKYVTEFKKQHHLGLAGEEHVATIGALLDLAGHKSPGMRVLEIGGGCEETTEQWLNIPLAELQAAQLTVVEVLENVILAMRPARAPAFAGREVVIVVHQPSPAVLELASSLANHLQQSASARRADIVFLDQIGVVELHRKMIVISMLEVEQEILASMGQEEMNQLRHIINTVTDLLWLTGGGMLNMPNPDLTLSNGLSRALMLEQPSLRFSVMDLGPIEHVLANLQVTLENVVRGLATVQDTDDKEFIQTNGLLYISRFGPDVALNSLFRRRLGTQEPMREIPIAKASPARFSIGQAGVTDSIYFQQLREPPTHPPAGFIDVNLKAVSLNAKDIYTISGRVETRTATTACEFSGIVVAVGSDIQHLQPGDRVLVSAPNHFTTLERVPAWAAHKLLPGEQFTTMATLPIMYSTALYALQDRTHLRTGESILVHSGAGALGLAMISIAKRIGAVIYATVGSKVKKDFLVNELGIPDTHIFSSRDASFVEGVQEMTGGKGIDVIINSLVGDLMHASWKCIAHFGRFVEVGKRELADAGNLNMYMFLRNATFTAFDFSDLFFSEDQFYRDIWTSKTKDVLELYRSGQIKPAPMAIFDVTDIKKAYRHFSAKDRVGKVVISFENPDSLVQVVPAKYLTVFDPRKVYLLVGCLGGLGRSLSRWMLARGARKFCFLGRSGCDKPSAKALVDRLRDAGATVTVVRGDISNAADATAAVAACQAIGSPIGGVVQAAMGLKEDLFSRMTSEAWQTAIRPKWTGTWNLHNALERNDKALDFFLLTSSMSGSVGTATESNYCAANGFLDAFARWRRSQGKPAISIGLGMISEVGYLHENPEIEALLLRRGIQPLDEEEFLQVIDMSLAGSSIQEANHHEQNDTGGSHILTGLEAFGLRKLMDRGFDVSLEVVQDPRAAVLSAAVAAEKEAHIAGGQKWTADLSRLVASSPWLQTVPANAISSFMSQADAPSLAEAVLRLTKTRFSNLILMPADQIDGYKPLSQFGVDSMIAAEFRTWFWTSFKVDVPFLDLLSPQKNLNGLAEFVATKLEGTADCGAS